MAGIYERISAFRAITFAPLALQPKVDRHSKQFLANLHAPWLWRYREPKAARPVPDKVRVFNLHYFYHLFHKHFK